MLAAAPARVLVFAYALTDQPSWWRHNISLSAHKYTYVRDGARPPPPLWFLLLLLLVVVLVSRHVVAEQEPSGSAAGGKRARDRGRRPGRDHRP